MLCVLNPSFDVMRDGARMTVRSLPTSKHVTRKERRYHVKNTEKSPKSYAFVLHCFQFIKHFQTYHSTSTHTHMHHLTGDPSQRVVLC